MSMREWFLQELESEAGKTRRVLEQMPTGRRDWKPHDKSMPLGYLAELVATIPSWIGYAISLNELDIAPKEGPKYTPTPMNTSAELVAGLDKAVAQARDALTNTSDDFLKTSWRLLAAGNVVLEQQRQEVIRDAFLHSAHHRGQLTVYWRLLGLKVPSVYGPTADDSSFG